MIHNACKALQPDLIKMRRDLHQIPEIGYHLPKTQAYVLAELNKLGIPYVTSKTDSSIIATISGGNPGKTVALRADMDALPIVEATGLPFASTNGNMHACGHDTHTTMLLGAAKVLNENKDKLNGTVRLLFQTAEELSRGSEVMIRDGAMEGVDSVFGMHIGTILSPDKYPAGTVICTPGCCMASYDKFIIKVKGVGCHGSTPEKGVDPVNIGAHIVLALEAINAREFNACVPVVVTIGSIHAGSQYNIIPSELTIEGTTRCVDPGVRNKVAERIGKIAEATAEAFGGSVEYTMEWGAPPVINDVELTALAVEAAQAVVGVENVVTHVDAPNMGGEDFANYQQGLNESGFEKKTPGVFMFLSSANAEKGTCVAHHNPKFDVDEDVLWMGSAVYVALAEKMLG